MVIVVTRRGVGCLRGCSGGGGRALLGEAVQALPVPDQLLFPNLRDRPVEALRLLRISLEQIRERCAYSFGKHVEDQTVGKLALELHFLLLLHQLLVQLLNAEATTTGADKRDTKRAHGRRLKRRQRCPSSQDLPFPGQRKDHWVTARVLKDQQ